MAENESLDAKLVEVQRILRDKQDEVLSGREKEIGKNKGLEEEKASLEEDLSIMDKELEKHQELQELMQTTGLKDEEYERKHEDAKKRHAAAKARRAQIEPEQIVTSKKIDLATEDPRVLGRLHEQANEEYEKRTEKEKADARPEADKEHKIRGLHDKAKRLLSKTEELGQMPRSEGNVLIRRSYDGRPIVVGDQNKSQALWDSLKPFDEEKARINVRLREEQSKRGLGKLFSHIEERHAELAKVENREEEKIAEIKKIEAENSGKEKALNKILGESLDYMDIPMEWKIPSFFEAKEEGEPIDEFIARRKTYLDTIIAEADKHIAEANQKPEKKPKKKTA